MSRFTTLCGLAALIPLLSSAPGCVRDGADPTVAAAAGLQRALEMDGTLERTR